MVVPWASMRHSIHSRGWWRETNTWRFSSSRLEFTAIARSMVPVALSAQYKNSASVDQERSFQ